MHINILETKGSPSLGMLFSLYQFAKSEPNTSHTIDLRLENAFKDSYFRYQWPDNKPTAPIPGCLTIGKAGIDFTFAYHPHGTWNEDSIADADYSIVSINPLLINRSLAQTAILEAMAFYDTQALRIMEKSTKENLSRKLGSSLRSSLDTMFCLSKADYDSLPNDLFDFVDRYDTNTVTSGIFADLKRDDRTSHSLDRSFWLHSDQGRTDEYIAGKNGFSIEFDRFISSIVDVHGEFSKANTAARKARDRVFVAVSNNEVLKILPSVDQFDIVKIYQSIMSSESCNLHYLLHDECIALEVNDKSWFKDAVSRHMFKPIGGSPRFAQTILDRLVASHHLTCQRDQELKSIQRRSHKRMAAVAAGTALVFLAIGWSLCGDTTTWSWDIARATLYAAGLVIIALIILQFFEPSHRWSQSVMAKAKGVFKKMLGW